MKKYSYVVSPDVDFSSALRYNIRVNILLLIL